MSGHIGKARFNDKNKSSEFTSNADIYKQTNNARERQLSDYATHGPLNDYYLADEASHTRFIQFPK